MNIVRPVALALAAIALSASLAACLPIGVRGSTQFAAAPPSAPAAGGD